MNVENQGVAPSSRGRSAAPSGLSRCASQAKPAATNAIYTASRASIPERSEMWRRFRDAGSRITSSWIDEAGEGETECFTDLWDRITSEIATADRLILYAEPGDFPLKGALIEVGIALGMGKPVTVCLPGVQVEGYTSRPIGSWIAHRLVERNDDLASAMSERNAALPAEDWTCEPCQAVNFGIRTVCRFCKRPRAEVERDNGSRPEGENSRSEVEAEGRQSGSRSEIAQPDPAS